MNGLIEHSVAIAHERSPWKTTHGDLRFAVETPSGGGDRRGVVPHPLTISAARVDLSGLEGQSLKTDRLHPPSFCRESPNERISMYCATDGLYR